jgi:hypothetical protein
MVTGFIHGARPGPGQLVVGLARSNRPVARFALQRFPAECVIIEGRQGRARRRLWCWRHWRLTGVLLTRRGIRRSRGAARAESSPLTVGYHDQCMASFVVPMSGALLMHCARRLLLKLYQAHLDRDVAGNRAAGSEVEIPRSVTSAHRAQL